MKRMKRPWKLSCQKHPKCNAHLLILLQKNWQKSRQKFGLICRVGRFCWWIHEEVTEVISCLQIYHRFSGNAKKKNSNIYKDTLLSTKAINSIGICLFFFNAFQMMPVFDCKTWMKNWYSVSRQLVKFYPSTEVGNYPKFLNGFQTWINGSRYKIYFLHMMSSVSHSGSKLVFFYPPQKKVFCDMFIWK